MMTIVVVARQLIAAIATGFWRGYDLRCCSGTSSKIKAVIETHFSKSALSPRKLNESAERLPAVSLKRGKGGGGIIGNPPPSLPASRKPEILFSYMSFPAGIVIAIPPSVYQ